MNFLEQLKVVSRRNKTIRKAFVSYRPDVRMIYYDATRENELRERIPVTHDNFLKSNRKTKLQRLIRRCCILFQFISTCIANRLCIETYLVLRGVAWRVAGSETITQNKILVVVESGQILYSFTGRMLDLTISYSCNISVKTSFLWA